MFIKFKDSVEFKDVKVGKTFQCKTGEFFLKVSEKSDYNAIKLVDCNTEENELLYSIGKNTSCRLIDAQLIIL